MYGSTRALSLPLNHTLIERAGRFTGSLTHSQLLSVITILSASYTHTLRPVDEGTAESSLVWDFAAHYHDSWYRHTLCRQLKLCSNSDRVT